MTEKQATETVEAPQIVRVHIENPTYDPPVEILEVSEEGSGGITHINIDGEGGVCRVYKEGRLLDFVPMSRVIKVECNLVDVEVPAQVHANDAVLDS